MLGSRAPFRITLVTACCCWIASLADGDARAPEGEKLDIVVHKTLTLEHPAAQAVFSPDSTRLALAFDHGYVVIADVADPRQGASVVINGDRGIRDGRTRVQFAASGKAVIIAQSRGYERGKIFAVRIANPRAKRRNIAEFGDMAVLDLAISADGRRLAAACGDGKVRVWPLDRAGGAPLEVAVSTDPDSGEGNPDSVAFALDDKTLVTQAAEHRLRVWDAKTGEHVRDLDCAPLTDSIESMAVGGPGARYAATGSLADFNVWDIETGEQLESVRGDIDEDDVLWLPSRFAFSPDGSNVVTDDDFTDVHLWKVGLGTPHGGEILVHEGSVTSIAVSPDGKWVASTDEEKKLLLWKLMPASKKPTLE